VRRLCAWLVAAALCCTIAAGSATAHSVKHHRPYQRVTIFSDSVGASLDWDPTAKAVMERGNRVRLELHPCGRLTQPGCISPPQPSVLSVVRDLGRKIGPTAILFIGYNDDPATYRRGIPTVLRALRKDGVKQVLWLTLQPVYKQYVDINQAIWGASRHHSGLMTVLDWGGYSHTHPSWFGSDGIHMTSSGAVSFATYIHRWLKQHGLTGPVPRHPS
jgi:hypothetical protein